MKITIAFVLLLTFSIASLAQAPQSDLQQFIRVSSNVVALTHVRLIDGTGAAPVEDQTILIVDGKITEIRPSSAYYVKEGIKTLDLNGYTVLPGGRHAADVFEHGIQFSATLSGARRDDNSHHRQRAALSRSRNQKANRRRSHDWSEDSHHCSLP